MNINQTITICGRGGGVLDRYGIVVGAEACSLTFSLKVLHCVCVCGGGGLSCLSPGWCGYTLYGWQCSLMESPCAVSLIVVVSFTLFTVRCGCIVNWVLCLLCGWIFHCALCGTARHLLDCWLEFYYVEFLCYRGRTVLYALCMQLLVLSVWWCTPPHG